MQANQQNSNEKVVLITGATRGIGQALAAAALEAGYRVVVNHRPDSADAATVIAGFGAGPDRLLPVAADVTVGAQVRHLIDATIGTFGRLDAVVNNAGIGKRIALEDLDEVAFSTTLHANLTSAFLVCQAAWPQMRANGGRLVFLSSGAARSGGGLSAAYAASKAGVEGLMHAYAAALRPYRITANAIAPALIETAMAKAIPTPASAELPMGRLGRPEELWPALRLILETEYLTGQTIHVDAGRYMT